MKRADGMAFLMQDGNLAVPGGRYGSDTEACAPVAWRLAYLLARETGEPITEDGLDNAMGLVVNSHDDVSYVINQYGHGHYS